MSALEETLAALNSLRTPEQFQRTSDALLESMQDALAHNPTCMLPSYLYRLPTGAESGHAMALDLGGSTLRLCILHLAGSRVTILHRREWEVAESTKQLPTERFFDWIAVRVAEVLGGVAEAERPAVLGVAWSFPIEQTSLSSGLLGQMGKGFTVHEDPPSRDLQTLFHAAFRRAGLKLAMTSLMNDTEATLLTHAYTHPDRQHTFSIILGTGLNAAITVPVSALPASKLGSRCEKWHRVAEKVLLNTELSMFGGRGEFPVIAADTELDRSQKSPGFQPLEQMTSGRYIGEVVRRVVLQLAGKGEVFRDGVPVGWEEISAFPTPLAIRFEGELGVEEARKLLEDQGFRNVRVTQEDVGVIGAVCRAVTERAAVYTGIAVWSLWRMQKGVVREEEGTVGVAYTGAVLEKHEGVRRRCQEVLDVLAEASGERWKLVLERADEAGLVGAAVGALVGDECEKEMSKL